MSSAAFILVHALALVVFINRYVGGFLVRVLRRRSWDQTVDDYEPSVTVVVPLFEEEAGIAETLRSVLASEYPNDKLNVICIDDRSADRSYDRASEVARESGGRLRVLRNEINTGKRASIIRAVREADGEIIVSVDSDVIVDRAAIRQLVRRFASPRIAAVGGWVDVRNKHDNWLTRMQVIKYWYAYFVMRNIEWAFRRMLCLSGCLTAYRKRVLVELEPVLERRALLGMPIKYGEDRFLTRQIVKAGYETTITLDARCRTFVPRTLGAYLSQQLRWRRSNLVDYAGGFSHVWKLNPLIAINYFAMFVVLLGYPIAVVRALASGRFLLAVAMHAEVLFVFGMYYRLRVRRWAPEDRVSGLSFLPQALVMPVTYGLMTPLALFTIDSTSWETRANPTGPSSPWDDPRDRSTPDRRRTADSPRRPSTRARPSE